jgi:hypothetical protein
MTGHTQKICPACGERTVGGRHSHWLILLPLFPWIGADIFQRRCADCSGGLNLLAVAAWALILAVAFVVAVILLAG